MYNTIASSLVGVVLEVIHDWLVDLCLDRFVDNVRVPDELYVLLRT